MFYVNLWEFDPIDSGQVSAIVGIHRHFMPIFSHFVGILYQPACSSGPKPAPVLDLASPTSQCDSDRLCDRF